MGLMGPGENGVSNTNRKFKGRMGFSEAGVHLANAYVAAAAPGAGEIVDPADVLEGIPAGLSRAKRS